MGLLVLCVSKLPTFEQSSKSSPPSKSEIQSLQDQKSSLDGQVAQLQGLTRSLGQFGRSTKN